MRCKKARLQISAMIDNELTGQERQTLTDHLTACRDCQLERDRLAKSWDMLQSWEEEIVPSVGFRTKFWARVREEEEKRESRWIFFRLPVLSLRAASVLAAAAVIIITVGLYLPRVIAPPTIFPTTEETAIAQDMEIYQNLQILQNIDLLANLEIIEQM
ncbi:MAG: zf-HC2 domain-containing protein [bacterium]